MSEHRGGQYGSPAPEQPTSRGREILYGTAYLTGGVLAVAGFISFMNAATGEQDAHRAEPLPSASAAPSPSVETYSPEGKLDIDRSCDILLNQINGEPVTPQHITSSIKEVQLRGKTMRIFGLQQAEDVMGSANANTEEPTKLIADWRAIHTASAKKLAGRALVHDAVSDVAMSISLGEDGGETAKESRAVITAINGAKAKELTTITKLENLGKKAADADYDDPEQDQASEIGDKAEEAFRELRDQVTAATTPETNAICAASPEMQQAKKDYEKRKQAEDTACDVLAEPARDACEADKAIEVITNDAIYEPDSANEWTARVSKDNVEQQNRIDTAEANKAIYYTEQRHEDWAGQWAKQVTDPYEARRVDTAEATEAIELIEGGFNDQSFAFGDAVADPTERRRVDQTYYSYVAKAYASGNGILAHDVIDHISDPEMRQTLQLTYPD